MNYNKYSDRKPDTPTMISQQDLSNPKNQVFIYNEGKRAFNMSSIPLPTPMGDDQSCTTRKVTPRQVFQRKMPTRMSNPVGDSQGTAVLEQTPTRVSDPFYLQQAHGSAENFSFAQKPSTNPAPSCNSVDRPDDNSSDIDIEISSSGCTS